MSDFSGGEDEVYVRYEDVENASNNSDDDDEDDEEINVAAGRRWDPLGEEKGNNDAAFDQTPRQER